MGRGRDRGRDKNTRIKNSKKYISKEFYVNEIYKKSAMTLKILKK